MFSLSKVSIGIRAFLRDEKMFNAIHGVQDTMPEVQMIVADCGRQTLAKDDLYATLIQNGHIIHKMEFDAGFGAMSNRIASSLTRPYLLIGSDDFDFNPLSVRRGIERMVEVLDKTDMSIASGRVGQHGAYEFKLEIQPRKDGGHAVIEHPTGIPQLSPWFVDCDLTVNYCLVKKQVFEKVKWDDDVKIGGGEHGAFFFDVKQAGFKVCYVPGASIQEQQGLDSLEYRTYRRRSNSPARPCFDTRNIKKYVLGCGQVDYERH